MVTRLRKPGRSFKDVHAYLTQGKDGYSADERLGWTHVLNLKTDDPEKAIRFMAYQHMAVNEAKDAEGATGRRIENPVFHWSLAEGPEHGTPDQNWWLEEARSFLQRFGLEDHPTVIYEHKDRGYSHMHGVTSLIDPKTGRINERAAKLISWNSKLRASKWAQERDQLHGHNHCPQRVENNKRREAGEFVRYRDPEHEQKALVTKLYFQSRGDDRKFQAALKTQLGLRMAGGRRPVLVNSDGKIFSLFRQIEGVKAKEIRAFVSRLELRDVEEIRAEIIERKQREKQEETRAREQAKLSRTLNSNTRRLNYLKERLDIADAENERDYGEARRTLQQQIRTMEADNSGLIRQTWLKLSGQTRRRKEQLDNLKKSLATIRQREEERRGDLARILEQRKARAVILNNRLMELQQPAPAQEQDRQPQQETIITQAGRSSTRRRRSEIPEPVQQRPPAPATAREFGEAAGPKPERDWQKVRSRTGRSRREPDRAPEREL